MRCIYVTFKLMHINIVSEARNMEGIPRCSNLREETIIFAVSK